MQYRKEEVTKVVSLGGIGEESAKCIKLSRSGAVS